MQHNMKQLKTPKLFSTHNDALIYLYVNPFFLRERCTMYVSAMYNYIKRQAKALAAN